MLVPSFRFLVELILKMPGCFIAGVLSQPHGGGVEVLRDQPQGLLVVRVVC